MIKRCSECHGPDQQKSTLRLDSRAAATQAGKSGHLALIPGRPEDSEWINRVTATDPDEVMPPKGARLTDREVAALRQWIQEGAQWPELDSRRHWAFLKPVRLPLPKVSDERWVRNEIDRFILARLEMAGLQPSAEADCYMLARRVHLDLTGLPPSRDETQAFVDDVCLAYRMQTSVPEVMDISKEPAKMHEAYGSTPGRATFANNCLLARRLVERGVRFVQLYHRGWDHHGGADGNLVFDLKKRCAETDQPAVALIHDLKERGLLDETLVLWGGEFGRTPMMQGALKPDQIGRDHHPHGYTIWMAGGGIKAGIVHGKTDEFGFYAIENKVHVHDLHATILHLFGLDHAKLTYHFQGRDFRLTDLHGEVVKAILA